MRKRTITVVVIVVVLIVAGLALRGEGGKAIEQWFIELHGGGGSR
jgi:hypothetical protein